jgi:N-acetylmuramoyl-L-alanine amidase
MTKVLIYLAEVSAISIVFFAFYFLLLKKLMFFKVNRFYLLFAVLLSFIIPASQITIYRKTEQVQNRNILPEQIEELHVRSLYPIAGHHQHHIDIPRLLAGAYALIAIFFLGMGLLRLFRLLKHTRGNIIAKDGLKIIYKSSGYVNCSFFSYVFIDPGSLTDLEMEILLRHEQVHARQYHSADKLFLLLCRALLWFNPIIYFYDHELEKVHEFEADAITSGTVDIKTYAHLLIKLSNEKTPALTHNFGTHPVKERITMLFNAPSRVNSCQVYFLVLPLVCGLIWLFSFRYVHASPISGPPFTLILDPAHGGTDKGAEFQEITEKELAFTIMHKIRVLAEAKGLKVISTRDKDLNVTLKDRAKIKGDFLLSLHCNAAVDKTQNGIQIMSSRPVSDRLKLSRMDMLSYNLYQNLKDLEGIRTNDVSKDVTGLYVLEKSVAPSILLELGFISNPADREYLIDPVKQNELTAAIVQSVLDYRASLRPLRE